MGALEQLEGDVVDPGTAQLGDEGLRRHVQAVVVGAAGVDPDRPLRAHGGLIGGDHPYRIPVEPSRPHRLIQASCGHVEGHLHRPVLLGEKQADIAQAETTSASPRRDRAGRLAISAKKASKLES